MRLGSLANDLVTEKVTRLILEEIDGFEQRDDAVLYPVLREHSRLDIALERMLPHEEPLLAVADALAWAYGAGAEWRGHVDSMLVKVEQVDPG